MDSPVKSAAGNPVDANPVATAIDGATGDWSMSGDAMRWSPELAERGPAGSELRSMEAAAVGLGSGLGLDMNGVRRLVSGALTSIGSVASEVVSEFRELTRGPVPEEPGDAGPESEDR